MTAEQERAAIVAYLVGEATFHRKASFDELKNNYSRFLHERTEKTLNDYLKAIELGAHHKETP